MKVLAPLIAVGCGGAIGSILRYTVTLLFVARLGPGFPWHTLVINVVGSFLIGAVASYAQSGPGLPPTAGAFLTVGVLGGFTTFSTFSYDTMTLINDGASGLAAEYCIGSVLLGLLAALGGSAVVKLALHAF